MSGAILVVYLQATDLDSGDFGRVQYRIDSSSILSVDRNSGMLTLLELSPSKFIEATVDGFDNLGNALSLTSSATVKVRSSGNEKWKIPALCDDIQVYFIENENLVFLTVVERKSQVDSNLDQIMK